jgi:shikimate kinase
LYFDDKILNTALNDALRGINLYLIGMMGVGKSTVGRSLAQQLAYRFIDTDMLIEQVAGQSIRKLFATQGEAAFRQLETQVLAELSAYAYQKLVIATGGGIVLKPENWSYLHHGVIIWLDAPVALLYKRLQRDTTRPLLQHPDPLATLQELLEQRHHLYAQSDLRLAIDAQITAEQVANLIVEKIPTVLKEQGISRSNKPAPHPQH